MTRCACEEEIEKEENALVSFITIVSVLIEYIILLMSIRISILISILFVFLNSSAKNSYKRPYLLWLRKYFVASMI